MDHLCWLRSISASLEWEVAFNWRGQSRQAIDPFGREAFAMNVKMVRLYFLHDSLENEFKESVQGSFLGGRKETGMMVEV